VKTLWRISSHDDLRGIGGERTNGRWHTAAPGKRVVYLSEHPALALIEVLANLKGNPLLFPDRCQLLRVDVPMDVAVEGVDGSSFPIGWEKNAEFTRAVGDLWLLSARSALLGVPSAPAPESRNYLLNPKHPHANKASVVWSRWVAYDKRLFHTQEE
jgi:RES domain-containing protein